MKHERMEIHHKIRTVEDGHLRDFLFEEIMWGQNKFATICNRMIGKLKAKNFLIQLNIQRRKHNKYVNRSKMLDCNN